MMVWLFVLFTYLLFKTLYIIFAKQNKTEDKHMTFWYLITKAGNFWINCIYYILYE
jgi:hypothetical protein